jgi:hypothetical protein
MTDGVLSNRGRVSALRVLSASMVAWELTDTETIGDSRIGRIEMWKTGLNVDLIRFLETRMGIMTKSATPVEMALVEVGTNHGFEQMVMDLLH